MLEGHHLVRDALAHHHPLEAVFVEPDAPDRSTLARCGVPVYELEPGTLAKVVDTVTPQPVAAIAPMPSTDDAVVDEIIGDGGMVMVLAGVSDPGNAGTLLRVAEAAGVGAVLFCDEAVDPFAPKCVRASAGSILHVPVTSGASDPSTCCRRSAVAAHDGSPLARAAASPMTAPTSPVRSHSCSAASRTASESLEPVLDGWTHVPMAGQAESLNVGVTGAVICFEAARQRARARRVMQERRPSRAHRQRGRVHGQPRAAQPAHVDQGVHVGAAQPLGPTSTTIRSG